MRHNPNDGEYRQEIQSWRIALGKFDCPACTLTFPTRAALDTHRQIEHGDD